jgi:hypothetical protein
MRGSRSKRKAVMQSREATFSLWLTFVFSPSFIVDKYLGWLKMAFYSQLVALGLQVSFIQYDLIVLQKT